MNQKQKLIAIYGGVAVICAGVIGLSMSLRSGLRSGVPTSPPATGALAVNTGKWTEDQWVPITRDLEGMNQAGEKVKFSDLKGKVTVVAEFFSICPFCAERNGAELMAIYEAFKSNPDFHIVCVSVDPASDDLQRLKDYASTFNADPKQWWFFSAGDEKLTHDYLEHDLKFFGIRERTDPADRATNGRFAHDLGFLLVDRDWQIVGKWPLAEARSPEAKERQPELYDELKEQLYGRIRSELAKKPATAER